MLTPQLILTVHLLNFNWRVAGHWVLATGKGKAEGRGFNDWGFRSADLGFVKGLLSNFYRDQ